MEEQVRRAKIDWDEEIGKCGLRIKDALKKMELCNKNCSNCPYEVNF